MTLTIFGSVMCFLGAWFIGAVYATDGTNQSRVIAAYASGIVFVGVGIILILHI